MDGRNVLDDFQVYPLTDIGSSKLYADMYKGELKFVRELGLFFYYKDGVWIKDIGSVFARRLAKKFAVSTVAEANKIKDEQARKTYVDYYNKFNSYHAREKLVKDAQTVYVIDYSEFDSKPYLYNCQNGTFNLKSGELQKHNPEDMLTQISGVSYNPEAKCDRWERYINEVMNNDQASINLLQMIAGYCLSGSTKFECFFMLYGGSTRNGKGTFNNTMMKMHGDYAKVLNPESLSVKSFYSNSEAPNESIASLAGARYVCVSEPGESLVLNSDLVKTLTGGDPIKARFLRQNSFVYTPAFKIVINTNFLPTILDDTIFSSDRLVLLNFERHFNAENRDNSLKGLFTKLGNISAIFNWCYEGYKMLEQAGEFAMPEKSRRLFEQYRAESDTLQQFIDECLIKCDGARVTFKAVYERYKEWSKENGYSQYSKKTLKKRMGKKVCIDVYANQDRVFDYEIAEDFQNPFT